MTKTTLMDFSDIEKAIVSIKGQDVLVDSDVAKIYGVETREINQAVKNNADKFPEGYILKLTGEESLSLRSKKMILEKLGRGQHSKYNPTAFTEKGLYMLATILKSPRATASTLAIIEAFAKLRELSRTVAKLSSVTEKPLQQSLMQKSGDIFAELIASELPISETESSFELNLAVVRFKHIVKKSKK